MAEVVGFAFGALSAIGLLGQIFDGCIKGYRIFTAAANLGRDSERLLCKVRIEEMRLQVWGREWGVAEGMLEQHLANASIVSSPQPPGPKGAAAAEEKHEGLKALAELILTQLYQTVMDLNKLQDRYGLVEAAPGAVDKEGYSRLRDPRTFVPGMRLRARWVINDKDKFGLFLEDLQYYNDRLEGLFPPARVATLQRTWRNELLQTAHRDVSQLHLLESASQGKYDGLSGLAELKQLRINLDATEPSRKILSSSELKIPKWRITTNDDDKDEATRCTGIYSRPLDVIRGDAAAEDVAVFVEWTRYDQGLSMDERLHLYQRVDNLARMLHRSSNKHPDLHTLDCLGYVDDAANHRYGHIYAPAPAAVPAVPLQSLAAMLAGSPAPDLGVRIKLAHTLAVALWACHSLDWLHKTLCPHNVLFFTQPAPTDSSSPANPITETSKPYLAGFDSSRPDHLAEMTVASRNEAGQDLYRHPDSLGAFRQTYRKSFDVYSLGLILLEVGLWRSLEPFQRGKHAAKMTPQVFRDKVIAALIPTLGPKAGARYRAVVQRCVEFSDPGTYDAGDMPHRLMEWVVQSLEEIRV